ncbi:hypothetical protein BU15DRAFT_74954 [Melanogaster broomeanus]|nr:hypothetical protein BU15DRAFT_74954 [Melanogaster broomeanus]
MNRNKQSQMAIILTIFGAKLIIYGVRSITTTPVIRVSTSIPFELLLDASMYPQIPPPRPSPLVSSIRVLSSPSSSPLDAAVVRAISSRGFKTLGNLFEKPVPMPTTTYNIRTVADTRLKPSEGSCKARDRETAVNKAESAVVEEQHDVRCRKHERDAGSHGRVEMWGREGKRAAGWMSEQGAAARGPGKGATDLKASGIGLAIMPSRQEDDGRDTVVRFMPIVPQEPQMTSGRAGEVEPHEIAGSDNARVEGLEVNNRVDKGERRASEKVAAARGPGEDATDQTADDMSLAAPASSPNDGPHNNTTPQQGDPARVPRTEPLTVIAVYVTIHLKNIKDESHQQIPQPVKEDAISLNTTYVLMSKIKCLKILLAHSTTLYVPAPSPVITDFLRTYSHPHLKKAAHFHSQLDQISNAVVRINAPNLFKGLLSKTTGVDHHLMLYSMLSMVPASDGASMGVVKSPPMLIVKETHDIATTILACTLPAHLAHLLKRVVVAKRAKKEQQTNYKSREPQQLQTHTGSLTVEVDSTSSHGKPPGSTSNTRSGPSTFKAGPSTSHNNNNPTPEGHPSSFAHSNSGSDDSWDDVQSTLKPREIPIGEGKRSQASDEDALQYSHAYTSTTWAYEPRSRARSSCFQPLFRILCLAQDANLRLLECKRGDNAVQVDTKVSVSDPSSSKVLSLADSDLYSSVSSGAHEESPESGGDVPSEGPFLFGVWMAFNWL